jgi:hypothetical protein
LFGVFCFSVFRKRVCHPIALLRYMDTLFFFSLAKEIIF